jgi:hypothetical protein
MSDVIAHKALLSVAISSLKGGLVLKKMFAVITWMDVSLTFHHRFLFAWDF